MLLKKVCKDTTILLFEMFQINTIIFRKSSSALCEIFRITVEWVNGRRGWNGRMPPDGVNKKCAGNFILVVLDSRR